MGNLLLMEELEGGIFWAVYLFYMLIALAWPVATYVLQSLGFYNIAKNRGIKNPWLSWLPIGESWILGCIADQYRYVAKGEVKNRRKAILVLYIVFFLIYIAVFAALISFLITVIGGAVGDFADYILEESVVTLIVMFVLMLAMEGVSIVVVVYRYIALFDLYKSCDPGNATLYLVLSIFISPVMPFLIFFLRNKEGGMPPRRDVLPEV